MALPVYEAVVVLDVPSVVGIGMWSLMPCLKQYLWKHLSSLYLPQGLRLQMHENRRTSELLVYDSSWYYWQFLLYIP